MAYINRGRNYYSSTEEHEYQRQIPYIETQTLPINHLEQLDNNGYFHHPSTELHRYGQNADRYTTNVSFLLISIPNYIE